MDVIFADIYQKEKNKSAHGIRIKDKSKSTISEDNIIWWIVVNIIRNQKISFLTAKGFELHKKIFIDVSVHRNTGIRKYHYIFTVSDEVDKRFKYEDQFYKIYNSDINFDAPTDLTPILDTIAFATIEKNKNFNFLISVPMQN